MDVSSEDEDSHGGLEEDIGGGSQDGDDTGSKASEGSPQAKTGKGPSGTRARRWFPVAQCSGWEEAQVAMHKLSVQQMSGAALHKGTVSATQGFLTYRFRCPFHGSHNCNWLCRVSIPLAGDATNAVAQKTPAEQRQHHGNHRCVVEVDSNFQHVDHAGPQSKGPHMLFVLEAQTTNEMWSWSSRRTQQWMHDRKIELAPSDDVKMFLNRLRRHSQRAREAKDKELLGLGNCIANPVTKLKVATENLTFDAATKDPNFNVHTIYLVPGSLTQDSDNGQDQPKLCLMFTSFNLILNVARAVYWYRDSGGAIAGIDHTFKVRRTCMQTHCAVDLCA